MESSPLWETYNKGIMEAKDTLSEHVLEDILQAVRDQVDVSFGQGYIEGKKLGIKEVVDWVKQYHGLDFEEAKAKLKEWNIEDKKEDK